MPRIPNHELERLKCDVSLLALVESQGHKLRKQGKDYVMLCPFHQEKTPSLVISPVKNLYHCFGCGAAGSVIDWLMKTQSLSLPQAVKVLQGEGVVSTSSLAAAVPQPRLLDVDESGQALLNQIVDHYHQHLLSSPEVLAWLEKRGLTHPEMIRYFKLGYSNQTLPQLLPSPSSKDGKALRERLVSVGVLRETTKQEHLRGCFVVPVIGSAESHAVAQRGRVLQLYGRRIGVDSQIRKGSAKHLYLPSPLSGVWNEAALAGCDEIILCEALIDALTFWCAGYRNVISSYGVQGFNSDHLAVLQSHGIKKVLIAYDRDEAGDTAAQKLAPELLERGIEAWRVQFPKGLDANDYAVKSGNAEHALGLALQQALWMGQGSEPNGVFAHEKPMVAATSSLAALPEVAAEQTASGEVIIPFGLRIWRIRGWQKNHSSEVMKVNVQVRDNGSGAFHVDQLDMYAAKQRGVYIKTAALELSCDEAIIKRDLGRVLLKLEQLQDAALQAALAPQNSTVAVSAEDESSALALLKSPDLIDRVVSDLASCGVVGESSNLLAGYLAAVSRKLERPLAVLIQSSSAAGKSSLMEAVLGLIPEEKWVQYSAMTGQRLYYLGETNLQHKILAIAEEEGVRQAAYALKLLQSDGELKIASTGKDEASGDLITREYTVKDPVMLMLTTTAIDVDEELLNRCLVLSVNESREQTQAIHALQRHKQTLAGLLTGKEHDYVKNLHQNAQRLLKPLNVVNPFASQLTFLSDKTRTRRDHMKYLTLIQSITLLHQYQRQVKRVNHRGKPLEYIEVERSDIALANRLAHEILGRTLDEMPPQTRKLLVLIQAMVKEQAGVQSCLANEVRFTRRDIREFTHWSDSQLKNHCLRLVEMEYLLVHGGSRGHLLQYQLLYDGFAPKGVHLCGLLDVENTVDNEGNESKSGSDECKSRLAAALPQENNHREVKHGIA
ncbi:CHC2 zinc finger domain-containing protein [Candidatus Regiella endosymbiont of Tuberolachnus salignus]|uniref:CHC2 zinc finger domain-containing protein n=1 Tax=Candidatus Regiella endosymbiont of Tuberolachnus salignus TaxID=3077956 RepID=UPI0030D4175F